MKTLDFYDLRFREKFNSRKYRKVVKMVNGRKRYFAVAEAPSGTESWRAISKEDYNAR